MKMIFKPVEVGWRLGRADEPRGGELWVPWDRTTGVIGPQGGGKTFDLLVRPAVPLHRRKEGSPAAGGPATSITCRMCQDDGPLATRCSSRPDDQVPMSAAIRPGGLGGGRHEDGSTVVVRG